MRHRRDDAARVGAGAALAAGLAGWLVLLLSGAAHPAELEDPAAEAAQLLENREPFSAEERAAEAEALLRDARRERVAHTVETDAEIGNAALGGVSPRRAWRAARQLAREVARWREPSETDAAALDLLEPLAGSQLERPDLDET